ncbi:MAG: tripartite tricarboxylate transporter substrate binding protein [Burkholderiaceae bacterium]|nr:tripartite tricarboxylate transporter substrate binding protein [Burkholderiales bacterium]MCZ8338128.1 tripartite tricarboxylate transporter substrate binding protein [Burkholderiaceae bacterium]
MIPKPFRRRCLATLSAAAVAAFAGPRRQAVAQSAGWPARPVRIVAPGAPGALFDLSARQIADKLAPALGQPVLVDNRPGAGGLLAMQHVARSAPDGHTFGVCAFTQLTVNPWMFDKPAYDPIADFAPVTALFSSPIMLATRPDSPIGSLAQLLEVARARPGRLSYGSSGVGQPPHVLLELVEHRARLHLVHVPYRGGPAAIGGLLAGDVDLVFEGSGVLLPQVRAGRLRPLAVTGTRRLAALPDVPTFGDAGIAGIDDSWMGVVAPAGTPADIVGRMQGEIARALEAPDVRASYESTGRTAIGNPPEAFAAMIRDGVPKWRELVKVAGLKPE